MTTDSGMTVSVEDRGTSALRERLHDRLEEAGRLRCPVHGRAVVAVAIHACENGWFDATWTTCCEELERRAAAVVKYRC